MIWWLGIGALAVINAAVWSSTGHPVHLLLSGMCAGCMIGLLMAAEDES